MRHEFVIREISKSDTEYMVRRWHYSDTLPRVNKHLLGCFENDALVGVVTLGFGTRPRHTIQQLFPSLGTSDYYEIGRMCMTDEMPRNSESQMLSKVVAWIRKHEPDIKVLFTWADGIMGKPGYVYQACSFVYAGFIESEIYVHDGIKLHPRGIKDLLVSDERAKHQLTARPTVEQMRELHIEHYRGRQFRYIKFLCSKQERKRLERECRTSLREPYPKSADLKWRSYNVETRTWASCDKPTVISDKKDFKETEQPKLFECGVM